jgi:hypothetical protein
MLQFTLQLSLACFAEYVLHLTRLNPDMMYIHQDSGLVNVSYFKFDVDDTTGELFIEWQYCCPYMSHTSLDPSLLGATGCQTSRIYCIPDIVNIG